MVFFFLEGHGIDGHGIYLFIELHLLDVVKLTLRPQKRLLKPLLLISIENIEGNGIFAHDEQMFHFLQLFPYI